MKKLFSFLLISNLLCVTLSNDASAQTTPRQLHIIYIDNSQRGGSGSGLSVSMMNYIFTKTLDSVNKKDKNIRYLLFISNGDKPYYSSSPDHFETYVNKLTESTCKYPSSLDDKRAIRSIIYQDKLSGFESVVLDFYVTNYYLNQELLNDFPGYMLNFFPKELQYVTKCQDNNITVNIYYPTDGGNKEKNLQQKLVMNDKRFASNIKYNFISK